MPRMHSKPTKKGMPKIFISYSRRDKVPVFLLKNEIESVVGKGSC